VSSVPKPEKICFSVREARRPVIRSILNMALVKVILMYFYLFIKGCVL
jgi:hypothetical protein